MNKHATPSTGWQLEQNAPEAYEEYLVPPMFKPWADQLIATAGISEGDRVLDVACGTGIVARRAASHVGANGTLVGMDINEGMLAVAKKTTADMQPPINWRQGDATDLPFTDESFEVVCCQQALQFIDDPLLAAEEIRRILAPGGRAALSVWRPLDHNPAYTVLADALEQHISEEAGAMMRSPFPAWRKEDLRTLLQDAGFDDVSLTIEIGSIRYPSTTEFVRREAASSPLAEPIKNAEKHARDTLVQDVENRLHRYIDDDGIVSPMEAYILTADL